MTRKLLTLAVLLVSTGLLVAQPGSIINSPHNLSVLGPGGVRASSEQQVCIFCHTPHNATPVQPLWNRNAPPTAYTVYSSNSLNAQPGQPTGSSKLCLSCHDGTIALGAVKSRNQPIPMAGGITTMPAGSAANLGTDLSDDHPISFRYDYALAAQNARLADPAQLPQQVRLDHQQELQCTTCHNAHDNRFGRFLVMDNSNSQLCQSCHTLKDTDIGGHQQCAGCHQPHSAPSGPYLLRASTVSQTCLTCHAGTPGSGGQQGPNIAAAMSGISTHDTASPVNLIDHEPGNVGCADCHEPHTMRTGTAAAPYISPRQGRITGVNAAGARVDAAQYEYEMCFKCHGDNNTTHPSRPRLIAQNNIRLQTAPSAVSYHPIQAPGKNPDVVSLRQDLPAGSMIYCTDCHGSPDSKQAGGTGADGPHGSSHSPLLVRNYTMTSGPESPEAYALCYGCHNRNSILTNQSFPRHRQHVEDRQASCATCHAPHGVPAGAPDAHAHLMNFDTAIVTPDPITGRLEYQKTGAGTGACYLSCHGEAHSPKEY